MFIRSERLFLRPGWPEDWEEVFSQIADELVLKNLADAPWPYTREDAKRFLRRPQERLLPNFLVTLPSRAGAQLVGSVGLSRGEDGARVGFWTAKAYWNQGFASEALRAVVGLAKALGHSRLTAFHFADSPASGRVLEKVGFRSTGEVFQQHSIARGEKAPAVAYVVDLVETGPKNDDATVRVA